MRVLPGARLRRTLAHSCPPHMSADCARTCGLSLRFVYARAETDDSCGLVHVMCSVAFDIIGLDFFRFRINFRRRDRSGGGAILSAEPGAAPARYESAERAPPPARPRASRAGSERARRPRGTRDGRAGGGGRSASAKSRPTRAGVRPLCDRMRLDFYITSPPLGCRQRHIFDPLVSVTSMDAVTNPSVRHAMRSRRGRLSSRVSDSVG